MRYLVTGLPRSRTAWLAVATGCPHEAISREGYESFKVRWRRGLSDSGAGFFLDRILTEIKPKTLIIERDKEDVIQSLERYAGKLKLNYDKVNWYLDELWYRLIRAESDLIKRVRFDDLNQLGAMRDALGWLGVYVPNLTELMHMNIESQLGWNLQQLREVA